VQLAAWDPDTGEIALFEDGRFVPFVPDSTRLPTVERSIDWFRGQRSHLPPARVLQAMAGQGQGGSPA
jgi:hypothetical protein